MSSIVRQDFNYSAGVNNAIPNFYKRFNMLLTTAEYLNLLDSFGSEVGIYGMGHLRMEMINYLKSVPNPKLPPAPPHQARYLGTYGWAWRTGDLKAAKAALLSQPGHPVLYEYSSNSWGGSSFWFKDNTGLLLEIFEPFPSSNPGAPSTNGGGSAAEDTIITVVFGVAGGLLLLGTCVYVFHQTMRRKVSGRGQNTNHETGIAL